LTELVAIHANTPRLIFKEEPKFIVVSLYYARRTLPYDLKGVVK
jgi:hypothetical protein